MMNIQQGFSRTHLGGLCFILSAALIAASAPATAATTKPTELPAQVIAHVPLPEAPGSEMLLQKQTNKQFLYVQKASKQGFMVVDVTKPKEPSLVRTSSGSNDATAGKLEMAGSDVGLAEIPDKNSKGVIRSSDTPTETVRVLDLTDPAHPKVLQTFTGVTSILQDPGPGLIFLTNNDGLWILHHPTKLATIIPAKKKKPCGSEDALSGMPPDCE